MVSQVRLKTCVSTKHGLTIPWWSPLLPGSCWCLHTFWELQHRRKRLGSIRVIPPIEDTEIFQLTHALSWHSTESDVNFW